MKTSAERTIEAMTWAAVVIWLGFTLIAHLLSYAWLVVMVLGIILLSSAIYQRSRGWHTSLTIWVSGLWMAVFSVIEIVDELLGAMSESEDGGLGIDLWVYLGIALMSMGVAVVLRSANTVGVFSGGAAAQSGTRRGYDRNRYGSSNRQSRADDRADYNEGRRPSSTSRNRAYADDYNQPRPSARGPRRVDDEYGDYAETRSRSAQRPAQSRSQRTAARYADRDRYGLEDVEQDAYQRVAARRPTARRETSRSQPADGASDLERRVEDIIQRSRERRGTEGGGEDLPY